MINKRLLVKNLLSHNDENSFYDKKRYVNIGDKEGKAKFLKHVCALANSNPFNNSFIVVGVEDATNEILGVDFFDDSKIQNLVNAYLSNPPMISYENIPFPNLPEGKVVGLVTIKSTGALCALRKNIWKYWGGTVFFREGSISMPQSFNVEIKDVNASIVAEIEQHASNNIELTLDGVIDFLNNRHADLESSYKVFKEQFVVCWAGQTKKVNENVYYSRLDIELINEQVKLFYSALDEVEVTVTEDMFTITEYVQLGLNDQQKYYPLEKVVIKFKNNGTYKIDSTLLFEPPQFDRKMLYHIFNNNNSILEKLKKGVTLNAQNKKDIKNLPATHLICFLNGFEGAKQMLEDYRWFVKEYDLKIYRSLKEALRILRKVKYA
ncbi:Putative DNA-binding domain-containing protein [Zhouia amylolytica]|uniref:Divergent AAA domain-containing protein n=2 Tax=Zhouia amylolytica TaxID=376730 RepID=W2UMV1_9FLAO|nr:ATP-binding protein [Zhouia amylolytica]ETN94677.1 divergent AAA domain-containing protein [Zhouia amylolytica AD3]MCQ0111675.1 putative DNA binding domain-containing protein [Zhouia amylolytica]SFS75763.1 Putative DNA-binding domain-containing protein [Zhouia amylolytica]